MTTEITVSEKTFKTMLIVGTIVIISMVAGALVYAHLFGGLSNLSA